MKKADFDDLILSVRQGGAILRGEMKPSRTFTFPEKKVQEIRKQYGLSQPRFAALLGISLGTLRNWEQGRRRPDGPARTLLRVVEKHPDAVLDTIGFIPATKSA